ncbi:putative YPT6-GTP-binding protein of the rab family [Fasciola gigantica]|uniref:Putative YPT6-GTP-binding protein of the rab family n=1 Tax=Fasciola gigantica TaxID=46835 RepID=A0A504ZB14_FASGI|nr:putative YPT6-GTP-binding protein of the rab family [Fasciola gigantica]
MGSRAFADYSLQKTKCVFLGQEDVGKTCILMRFMHDIFDSSYHATIGIDFLSRTIVVDKQTVRLQLWDTAGQERFRSLIPSYIRDSSVSIVVYDVTSRTSFEQTSEWIKRIRETKPNEGIIFLVGNKTDLTEKRVVSFEEGSAKAKKERVHFCETSAKSGTGVNGLFKQIGRAILKHEKQSVVHTKLPLESNSQILTDKKWRCWCY